MAKLVSQTYGEALFELAMEQDKIDVFTEEIDVISEVLAKNPDFSKLMNHPKIEKTEKCAVMENILKGRAQNEITGFLGRIDKELVGFLRLLVTKGRYADLDSILQYFRNAVKEEKGIGVAYVKSAAALSDRQKKQIEEKLLETTKYTAMEMHYSTDAAIIGGLVIRIGDHVVDSSIATKLNELKKQLMKIQLA